MDRILQLIVEHASVGNHDHAIEYLVPLVTSLGLLFIFKYYGFFSDATNSVLALFDRTAKIEPLDLLLPVGISFYIFQTLSYTIDVYRGIKKP